MNAIRDGTVLALCLFLTPLAGAAEYEVDFEGTMGRVINYSLNGGQQTGEAKAGYFMWTVLSSNSDDHPNFSPGQMVKTFCTELTQFVGSSYDGADLEDIPDPGDPGSPQFSDTRQSLVSELFGRYYKTTVNKTGPMAEQKNFGAAFQLALWEIMHEGSSSDDDSLVSDGMLDVEDGEFSATQKNEEDGALTIANAWLASLQGGAPISDDIFGWTNENKQDQVIFIPLPAPLLLAGVGLAGVVAARRGVRRLI